MFLPAFLVRWGQEPQQVDGAGLIQATFNFPNRLCIWEELGATHSFGCKLILLPICTWESTSFGVGFALRVISVAPPPPLCPSTDGPHGFQVLPPTSLVRGGWETLHSRWGCDSAGYLSVDKTGSRIGKTPPLRNQSKQICIPSSSLVRAGHQLGSADEQSTLMGILLGCHRYELCLPRCMCWLLQGPSHFLVTLRFPVVESCGFPCKTVRQDQSSESYCWGWGRSLDSSKGTGGSGLREEKCIQCVATSLILIMQSALVSVV